MNTLIKGLKEIVSLYKYCEMNGLLYKDDTMSINKEDSDPEFDLGVHFKKWQFKILYVSETGFRTGSAGFSKVQLRSGRCR